MAPISVTWLTEFQFRPCASAVCFDFWIIATFQKSSIQQPPVSSPLTLPHKILFQTVLWSETLRIFEKNESLDHA